jgi:hypothetical protein
MEDNILGIVALIISIGSAVIGAINHTKIRSACCGRKIEASIDIDKTGPPTPPQEVPRSI